MCNICTRARDTDVKKRNNYKKRGEKERKKKTMELKKKMAEHTLSALKSAKTFTCALQRRTVYAAIYFVCGTYLMTLLQVYSDRRHLKYYENASQHLQLPDVGYDVLPPTDMVSVLDVMVNVICIFAVGCILWHRKRQLYIRRLGWIQATIHIIRGVALFVTTLPNPYNSMCVNTDGKSVFLVALKVSFRLAVTCSDIVVSGHSATTLSALFLILLYTKFPGVVKALFVVYVGFVDFLIISSRFHYTVDVVLGAIISTSVYITYHWGVHAHRAALKGNAVKFLWMSKAVSWADGDETLSETSSHDLLDRDDENKRMEEDACV